MTEWKQRESKFRAWNTRGERWEDPFLLWSDDGGPVDLDRDGISSMEDVLVTQYTGLKDREGMEIYEGDRLKYWGYNDDPVLTVVFHNGCFGVHTPWGTFDEADEEWDLFEVVGNVFENPELIPKE